MALSVRVLASDLGDGPPACAGPTKAMAVVRSNLGTLSTVSLLLTYIE